jgi:hypothetical protein
MSLNKSEVWHRSLRNHLTNAKRFDANYEGKILLETYAKSSLNNSENKPFLRLKNRYITNAPMRSGNLKYIS